MQAIYSFRCMISKHVKFRSMLWFRHEDVYKRARFSIFPKALILLSNDTNPRDSSEVISLQLETHKVSSKTLKINIFFLIMNFYSLVLSHLVIYFVYQVRRNGFSNMIGLSFF